MRSAGTLLGMVLLLGTTGEAQAAVMTFNGTVGFGGVLFIGSHSEAGFTVGALVPNVFLVDENWNPAGNILDDDFLDLDTVDSRVRFTRDGGGSFDLVSVVVAQLLSPGSLRFIGNISGGGTVQVDVNGCGLDCLDTVSFTGFTNLDSLEVVNTAQYMMLDNVEFASPGEPVPEPTTLALLGGGLAGIVTRRRQGASRGVRASRR